MPGPVKVVYEAGPTGFGLYRHLVDHGISCVVAAPSKLQRPAGDRVKTDARDAAHLARLLKLGEIVEVTVPSVTQEAALGISRGAGEDVRGDLMRARHRGQQVVAAERDRVDRREGLERAAMMSGSNRSGSTSRAGSWPSTAPYETMLMAVQRRNRLDQAIIEMAEHSEFTDLVHRLGCLRGIATLTGFGLAVEIGDWHRFTGSSIGAFLGLVPTEHSSGQSRSRGCDHQDRQQPCPPAAGRGGLAASQDLPSSRPDHADPLGAGSGGGAGPRP